MFFEPADGEAITPVSVKAEVQDGAYSAFLFVYPEGVTKDEALNSVHKRYARCPRRDLQDASFWLTGSFIIAVYQEQQSVYVAYVMLRPGREVASDVIKVGVFGAQTSGAGICGEDRK